MRCDGDQRNSNVRNLVPEEAEMTDVNDPRATAWAAVHHPGTTAARLAEIAQAHPEFAGAVAVHPQAYPELVNWAQQAQQALALANAPAPVASVPAPVAGAAVPALASVPSASEDGPLLTPLSHSPSRPSGWEIADKAAHGVGAVVNGTATVITKLYGLGLLIVGVVAIFALPATWWGGLLIAAYGIYLLLPGSKWVIW
jgi:hypothetical protein